MDGSRMNSVSGQFIRFTGVGAIGTMVHYSILVALVHFGSLDPVAASTCGFLGGAVTNYLLNYHYTFASDKGHTEAFSKFFLIAIVGMLFNGLIMSFSVNTLNMPYMLAQIMATGLVLVWNFTGNRLWTFNTGAQNRKPQSGE